MKPVMKLGLFFLWALFFNNARAFARIHDVPIVLVAKKIPILQFYQVNSYRVFKSDENGNAIPIPFQIDQKDRYDDFSLDEGKAPNRVNKPFAGNDELSLMGKDIGIKKVPKKWGGRKPDFLYEVVFRRNIIENGKSEMKEAAIYVGIYRQNPPPLSNESYVKFDIKQEEVLTKKYRYLFNTKNYLVVRGVNIEEPGNIEQKIIMSSAVYMKLDMKYFLTLNLGHSDIESNLDAYKVGPIRVIARVNFDYKILKMKFDLGMYTEVSFFSNSVNLPAIIDNPLDGKKSLNKGSYFYYGLALVDNPKDLTPKSNMPDFKNKSGYWKSPEKKAPGDNYWAFAQSPSYTLYLEFLPSTQMEKDGNVPNLYVEHVDQSVLKTRKTGPLPLGESPVNVAVTFALDNFARGLHQIRFRVYIENEKAEGILEEFKDIDKWGTQVSPIRMQDF